MNMQTDVVPARYSHSFVMAPVIRTRLLCPAHHRKPMLWAVLHGLGQSSLVAVDPDTMQIVQRFKRVRMGTRYLLRAE